MSKNVLCPIYEAIYGDQFDVTNFDKRIEMQKAIFMMEEMGIYVGYNDHFWNLRGPYSQELQDDMKSLTEQDKNTKIKFSKDALYVINKLSEIFNKKIEGYTRSQWAECIASIYYLKKRLLSPGTSNEEILTVLVEKKPHLDNENLNSDALQEVLALV